MIHKRLIRIPTDRGRFDKQEAKMKGLVCCAILMLVCVLTQVEGDCLYNDEHFTVGEHYRNCLKYTCHEGGYISMLGCAVYQCADGKQIGYREKDLTKPYPECCEGPICKDD